MMLLQNWKKPPDKNIVSTSQPDNSRILSNWKIDETPFIIDIYGIRKNSLKQTTMRLNSYLVDSLGKHRF